MKKIISKETWDRLENDYLVGNFRTSRELALRYGVSHNALRTRIFRGRWKDKAETFRNKLKQNLEEKAKNRAEAWEDKVFKSSESEWDLITNSIQKLVGDMQSSQGIDPEAIGGYVRARKLLDDMARRSLGLVDPAQRLDVTSRGLSVGESFISAISKLRADPNTPKLGPEDLKRVLEAEIIDDEPSN